MRLIFGIKREMIVSAWVGAPTAVALNLTLNFALTLSIPHLNPYHLRSLTRGDCRLLPPVTVAGNVDRECSTFAAHIPLTLDLPPVCVCARVQICVCMDVCMCLCLRVCV